MASAFDSNGGALSYSLERARPHLVDAFHAKVLTGTHYNGTQCKSGYVNLGNGYLARISAPISCVFGCQYSARLYAMHRFDGLVPVHGTGQAPSHYIGLDSVASLIKEWAVKPATEMAGQTPVVKAVSLKELPALFKPACPGKEQRSCRECTGLRVCTTLG